MTPNRPNSLRTPQSSSQLPQDTAYSGFLNRLQTLLTALLGRSVTVRPSPPRLPAVGDFITGLFSWDDGRDAAWCRCDLPLAVYSGAALGLFSAGVAREALAARKLSDSLLENFHEVLNVCARLLNEESKEHLFLSKVITTPHPQPHDDRVVDCVVEIAGYGSGRLILRKPF